MRAQGDGGTWQRLTDALIPAQRPGDIVGASYTYSDVTARQGSSYSYAVEEVNLGGGVTSHAPFATLPEPI